VAALVGALATARLSRPPRPRRPAAPDARLATNVAAIALRGRHVTVRARATARVKLREDEAAELIRRRGPEWGTTLSTRPAAILTNRATVRESPGSQVSALLPAVMPAPEVALRAYRDVTCAPGQVAWRGNVILSDSFRHNARPGMHNKHLDNVSARFARTPEPRRPVGRLEGAYFYLDSESRGHFGHAMTEQLSRLWAWREAKAAFPDAKALMLVRNRELAPFEPVLYAAAGVDPEDLVVPAGTVQVDTLVAATPMFSQPEYVHPDLPAFWQQVGEALAERAPDGVYPSRIFCSRRHAKRACTNAPEVEDLFTAHGFAVVYPEDYPLTAQSRMFREADVIAGYAGSAMFTTAFTGRAKHVILVASESYPARNEHLIAAALGHRLDVAWCVSQRPKGRPGFDRAAARAPYTFDLAREGVWLRDVLAECSGLGSPVRVG
jgi:capsular polysaccharide biosynthesis protein